MKVLLEVAEVAVNPVSAGEVNPPQPDYKRASALCDKVLDMPVTPDLRADVLLRKATFLQKSGDHLPAHSAFHAWLVLFDKDWALSLPGGKPVPEGKPEGKHRLAARLHLAESLLATHRYGDARLVAKELGERLAALPADNIEKKKLSGTAAWLYVQTFAPQQRASQAQPPQQQVPPMLNAPFGP